MEEIEAIINMIRYKENVLDTYSYQKLAVLLLYS